MPTLLKTTSPDDLKTNNHVEEITLTLILVTTLPACATFAQRKMDAVKSSSLPSRWWISGMYI